MEITKRTLVLFATLFVIGYIMFNLRKGAKTLFSDDNGEPGTMELESQGGALVYQTAKDEKRNKEVDPEIIGASQHKGRNNEGKEGKNIPKTDSVTKAKTTGDSTEIVQEMEAAMLNLPQEDPSLAKYIRERWINRPSGKPLNLTRPDRKHYSQVPIGQSGKVERVLQGRENGFFIECGAGTGEQLSNSLFFEKSRGWTGLLIEANPFLFEQVKSKQRNAYTMNACISPTKLSSRLKFDASGVYGGLQQNMDVEHLEWVKEHIKVEHIEVEVPCFPLYSVLRAINVDHVDYFSLDVEGPELEILQTIPFDRITFDVITVEYYVTGCNECSEQKKQRISEFMAATGQFEEPQDLRNLDLLFVRSGIA